MANWKSNAPPLDGFGRILWDFMKKKEVNQNEVSKRSGYGTDTVSRIIHNDRRPTETQVLRLARALNLTNAETTQLLDAAEYFGLPETS